MSRCVLFFFMFVLVKGVLFGQDTLRNLSEQFIPESFPIVGNTPNGSPLWGDRLGMNIYSDDGFAEKYSAPYALVVEGLIAYLGGTSGGTGNEIFFEVYGELPNGKPSPLICSVSRKISELFLGGVNYVSFNEPPFFDASFFVGVSFFDYDHSNMSGDTVHVMAGPHGSRSGLDLMNYGRNVVRWHGHTTAGVWKDLYTENGFPLATHLALFPVVREVTAGHIDLGSGGVFFPNPVLSGSFLYVGSERLHWLLDANGNRVCSFIPDANGKVYLPDLPSGIYFLGEVGLGQGPVFRKVQIDRP
jgi:hypothetical protein